MELPGSQDLDVQVAYPEGLRRLVRQGLIDFSPWHILDRDAALVRLRGLRQRYSIKYVPFARRQDNDDIACIDPTEPGRVIVVHDFASAGFERRQAFGGFWDWFRAAVEDMVEFE